MIGIVDFGSQYTRLIHKSIRSLGVGAKIYSSKVKASELESESLQGLIFSGSPASAGDLGLDEAVFEIPLPKLAICFGYQMAAKKYGGSVAAQNSREYGRSVVIRSEESYKDLLLEGMPAESIVWMSHGDSVTSLPKSASSLLTSDGKPAAFHIPEMSLWALQFHPEVAHSEQGERIFENFLFKICKLERKIEEDLFKDLFAKLEKELKGVPEVTCAVSGGVDSTVLAVLLSRFTKVKALFVDHGFLRNYDESDLEGIITRYPNIDFKVLNEKELFWSQLRGVSDPEEKRKIIGKLFIEVFEKHLPKGDFTLAQGTIYSDVIESADNSLAPAQKIKSHHNVGGLPPGLKVKLLEPLRELFKDEVRVLGKALGIEAEFLDRHPFPGPGLAIRMLGPLDEEWIDVLKRADAIYIEELHRRGLYKQVWQAGAILLPVQTVGVMGDGRTYERVLALRAVSSREAMTAEATELPWKDLKEIASRIVNEVRGINRVVFDLTSKPPATIEWE
ncbi:MAG: glutamine-hydrolyzing GMP synthase [Bdellovibrionota bacterium]